MKQLQAWGRELGFSHVAVADIDLRNAEPGLQAWLDAGFHGDMHYMQRHGMTRARPHELVPETLSVITARMDYLPADESSDWVDQQWQRLAQPASAVVSIYARGRDYHKVMRQRLQRLADRIQASIGPLGHRVFTDSAPVLECELAQRSGQGWRGKHTLILNRQGGSTFFLGEIFLSVALPKSSEVSDHCGQCQACIGACPTGAIVEPYRLDARKCISYLSIEHAGPIPTAMRPLMGNRIYGCDDCQLACPWNKYAQRSEVPDFDVRPPWREATLLQLWAWSEAEFLAMTEGSAIRRIGYERWQRNLAVAMGNALRHADTHADDREAMVQALSAAQVGASELVREHIDWALGVEDGWVAQGT